MFSNKNVFCACVVGLVLIAPAYNAPRNRSKGNTTKFDQKQTGDYNVQLHLKDFHIVAVLGDGSWGNYGDYDYNYDYSDLTIKPIIPITTSSPQDSPSTSEVSIETQKPEAETQKPHNHPYPIVSPLTTLQPAEQPSSTTVQPQSTTAGSSSTTAAPSPTTAAPSSTTAAPSSTAAAPSSTAAAPSSTTAAPSSTKAKQLNDDGSEKTTRGATISTTKRPEAPQPTKGPKKEPIDAIENSASTERKPESSVTNISIVSGENTGVTSTTERVSLGEIMHYRKCADGYARDKQGRCRKIRRTPQIPFGITRLASNLASRFRQATAGESTL